MNCMRPMICVGVYLLTATTFQSLPFKRPAIILLLQGTHTRYSTTACLISRLNWRGCLCRNLQVEILIYLYSSLTLVASLTRFYEIFVNCKVTRSYVWYIATFQNMYMRFISKSLYIVLPTNCIFWHHMPLSGHQGAFWGVQSKSTS